MVSKSNHLTNLFKVKAGLVEACLLPFFTVQELIAVASLQKTIRRLFDPDSSHHINFVKTFSDRLEID